MIKQIKNIFVSNNRNSSSKGLRDKLAAPFSVSDSLLHNNRPLHSNYNMYLNNPCVKRAVSVIATSGSSIKFKLFHGDKFVEKHPLYDFFQQPNPNDSWISFIEGLITNFMIFGNAYVILMRRNGRFELHNLESDKMKVTPGEYGVPSGYVYSVDGKELVFDNDNQFPYVFNVKTFNPSCPWYGISPLDAIRHSANLHHAITVHNLALLQNGGRVGGVVSIKRGAVALTDAQKAEIRRTLIEQYQGPHNAGRIAIIEGGDFSWTPMGESASDMDFGSAKILAAREIAEALGVPLILVLGLGVASDSSKASVKEIIDRFHEGTVLPVVQKMFNFLNNFIISKIAPGFELRMDLDHFLPLHGKRIEWWAQVNDATFLSDDEKRALLGLRQRMEQIIME